MMRFTRLGAASDLPPSMRPNETTPDDRVVDQKTARWDRVEVVTARHLRVHYTITGRADCAALGRVAVAESATTVQITIFLGRLPDADCGRAAIQLAASMSTTVTLAEPVGGRTIVDGAG